MTIRSLCVDGLLPASAVALFTILWDYRAKLKVDFGHIIPLLILPTLIKSSGTFFSVSGIAMALYFFYRVKPSKKQKYNIFAFIICSVLLIALWKIHVSIAFSGTASPHVVSISRYFQIFTGYNSDEINQIVHLLAQRFLSIGTLVTPAFVTLVLGGIYVIGKQNPDVGKRIPFFWGYLVTSYFIYLIGMAFIYLFSMERNAAFNLTSFSRYLFSMDSFAMAISVIYIKDLSEKLNDKKMQAKTSVSKRKFIICLQKNVLPALYVFGICLLTLLTYHQYINRGSPYVLQKESRKHSMELLQGKAYEDLAVYVPKNSGYFRISEIRYDARTSNVDRMTLDDEDRFIKTLQKHRYMMIWQKDERLEKYFADKGVYISNEGIYSTEELIK